MSSDRRWGADAALPRDADGRPPDESLERTVEELQARLARVEGDRSALVASVSHDLRTPLNGIIGMLDLLARTPLGERQRRYTDVARASAQLLLSTLDELGCRSVEGTPRSLGSESLRAAPESAAFSQRKPPLDGRLPALGPADGHGAAGAPAPLQGPAEKRARILVVEDSDVNAEVTSELLRLEGYAFDVVGDGAAAEQALLARPYDMVLMDCQLPVVDGFDATARIRAAERDGRLPGRREGPLPIVALTASVTPEARERCFAVGMTEYVAKPIDARRLLDLVARLAEGASWAPSDPRSAAGPSSPAAADTVVDLKRALDRLRGNRALLANVVKQLSGELPGARHGFETAVEVRDARRVAFLAHRLRGQAAVVDARRTMVATTRIEDAAKGGQWERVEEEWRALSAELDHLASALERSTALAAAG